MIDFELAEAACRAATDDARETFDAVVAAAEAARAAAVAAAINAMVEQIRTQ